MRCTGTMTRAQPGIAKEMQIEAFACELELDHDGPHTSGEYGWHGPPITARRRSEDDPEWLAYQERERWWQLYAAVLNPAARPWLKNKLNPEISDERDLQLLGDITDDAIEIADVALEKAVKEGHL